MIFYPKYMKTKQNVHAPNEFELGTQAKTNQQQLWQQTKAQSGTCKLIWRCTPVHVWLVQASLKNSGFYGIQTLDRCDTSAAVLTWTKLRCNKPSESRSCISCRVVKWLKKAILLFSGILLKWKTSLTLHVCWYCTSTTVVCEPTEHYFKHHMLPWTCTAVIWQTRP